MQSSQADSSTLCSSGDLSGDILPNAATADLNISSTLGLSVQQASSLA